MGLGPSKAITHSDERREAAKQPSKASNAARIELLLSASAHLLCCTVRTWNLKST